MTILRIALIATAAVAALALTAVLLHREQRVERSVDIAAPPAKVWAALTDFAAYPEWNPFIRQLSGTARTGATLTVEIHPAGGKAMTFSPTLLAADPGRELRWLGRVVAPGLLDGEHAFTLEAIPGGTRLTQSEDFSGVLVPFVGSALDVGDDFAAMNAAIRDRVEAGASITR
ncbi:MULTISPECIES: SRPBCC family protein [unclassified Knoellia]|uniref:SRPBCC family protein n=1 Tax=Knoellia altitudinis TaxID=3404795 RepID=UPI00360E7FD2